MGGGRSRPAQSCETPGASGHVSARSSFSKLQPPPGPAGGPLTERKPRWVRSAPPSPPPPISRRGSRACGRGGGAALRKAALSPGGRGPRLRSPRPSAHLSPEARPYRPDSSPQSPLPRPHTSATRPNPRRKCAELRLPTPNPGHAVPSSVGSLRTAMAVRRPPRPRSFRVRIPRPPSNARRAQAPAHPAGGPHLRLLGSTLPLTSGPRRPSEHLEEGGTPGTWQL